LYKFLRDSLSRNLTQIQAALLKMITELQARGAEGIILGCTELDLLVEPADVTLPLFDTTQIHAQAAVDLALS
jgi:aspartate racemase